MVEPSVFMMATKLLHHLGRVFQDNPPDHAPTRGSDRKQRMKEREKKIAMGHAEKDYVQEMYN
jgi:hypothetical protein